MRAVLQRVVTAHVEVDGEVVGRLEGPGVLALIAAAHDDGPQQVQDMARKIAELRILRGEQSVADSGAGVLVVSQFTLYGRTGKGRRPSWGDAAPADVAEPLVDGVKRALRERGIAVATGSFGADMQVHLVGDGPVTLLVDV